MSVNHQPETDGFWDDVELSHVWVDGRPVSASRQDADYVVHCVSAYPKLVEFIRSLTEREEDDIPHHDAREILQEFGELD